MIDLLTKLPDSALGILLAGATWFGFNYAVLADRALQRELVEPVQSLCEEASVADTPAPVLGSGIGALLGMPELDDLEARIIGNAMPQPLSRAQKLARCSCGALTTAKLRFDYAVHTASFRLIPASEAAALRERAAANALSFCK